jgi:hypothetical protein
LHTSPLRFAGFLKRRRTIPPKVPRNFADIRHNRREIVCISHANADKAMKDPNAVG